MDVLHAQNSVIPATLPAVIPLETYHASGAALGKGPSSAMSATGLKIPKLDTYVIPNWSFVVLESTTYVRWSFGPLLALTFTISR